MMNSRNFKGQQYEQYLSSFGKKVLGNLVKNLKERNECNKIQFRDRKTYSQNKRVINFGDSYISSTAVVGQQMVNESHNNIINEDSLLDTNSRLANTSVVTSSHGLLESAAEDEMTEKVDACIEIKNDVGHPGMALTLTKVCTNRRVSDDVCETKQRIEWDDIFDTQLLNDLNILDKGCNINIQTDTTAKNSLNRVCPEYNSDLGNSQLSKPAKTIDMTKNIYLDCKNLLNQSINDNIESTKSKTSFSNKNKMKRPSVDNISKNVTPKKVKKSITELPKMPFRKQNYTKVVKSWLSDVEHEKIENEMELQSRKETSVVELLPETSGKSKEIKITKQTVQSQLTNKGGVMKFGRPKQNQLLVETNITDVTTKNSVSHIGATFKEKKAKSKFLAPLKLHTPIKNVSYNIISLNNDNYKEHATDLGTVDGKEINMLITFSNGSCQLNRHYTNDTCVADGAMFEINGLIYYWKHIYEKFCSTMENIINQNTIVCYDGKNLLKYFASQGDINVNSTEVKVLDVQIGGSLIDPDNAPENFTNLQKFLGIVPEYNVSAECALQKCAWYLGMLGECCVRLRSMLIEYKLWNVFVEIEMRVLPIVAEMERRGVRVDTSLLAAMERRLARRLRETQQACHAAAGRDFCVGSALQVRTILYDELQLDARCDLAVRETLCKGDKSTSESMLRCLVGLHPLPRLILEYRHVHKAHATFLAGIAHQVQDGAVRPTWEQTAAATGRIACSNPNLQAIPKAPFSLVLFPTESNEEGLQFDPNETLKFRSVYVPREGHVLVAADFKHVECRVLAAAARDTGLLAALASPDLFRVLAAQWLNKSEQQVSAAERERTKRVVYASLYGAGGGRLAGLLGGGRQLPLSVVDSFNRTFPSLKSFGRAVVAQCEQRAGRLTTLCGRSRIFRNIFSCDIALKSQAERQAVNFIVQGSAADLCKLAMVHTERRLRGAVPPIRAHLLLQIHDELVWEVEQPDLACAAAEIKSAMEGVGKACGLAVALPVAISAGRSWGEMEQYNPAPCD